MSDYDGSRRNQYFVPGDGISREVIQADICKYLDNDATVRPQNYQGRDGYMIYAYRNLTTAMIDDLKRDSAAWQREQLERRQRGARRPNPPEDYRESRTHQRRLMTGPSVPETPSPGIPDFPSGRAPPPMMDYRAQSSPQSDSQYSAQSVSSGYPPSARNPGYPGYVPISEAVPPGRAMPAYDYQGYPPEPGYGSRQVQTQQVPMAGALPPQPPQTAPPVAQRDMRGEYADPRGDPRSVARQDPRGSYPDARMDPRYQQVDGRRDHRQYGDSRGYAEPRYRR